MRPSSPLRRLLLYAHDTYGLGHLRRNLAIARHLLEATRGLQIVLVSGSPVADRFEPPRGLTVVPLPPVVKVGPDEYEPRDPRLKLSLVRRARAAIVADVARRFEPDVFLVDHSPQGMKGELLPVFEALRASGSPTRIVLGLRDVLDDGAVVRRMWQDQGVYRTLEEVFDRVLVYGNQDLFDVVAEYALPSSVAARTTFCGYLGRPPVGPATPGFLGPDERFVLGMAGGGGDGEPVLAATMAAAESAGVASVLVAGPFMPKAGRASLEAQARGFRRARVIPFVPELGGVMRSAAAVVTMAGYNALCELVSAGARAVVVPRTWPRREQTIRAELFAARGLVRLVEPGPELVPRLAAALAQALEGRAPAAACLDLDGMRRVRSALVEEAGRAGREPPEPPVGAGDREEALLA